MGSVFAMLLVQVLVVIAILFAMSRVKVVEDEGDAA